MSDELNVESGDTMIITMPEDCPHYEAVEIHKALDRIFKGQNVKVGSLPYDAKLTLIKSSNLEDNTDLELRENNPALQDAWEKYQLVKNLTVENNGTGTDPA